VGTDYSTILFCTLILLDVVEGQAVEEGQILAVVEAMKMQNALRAPKHTVISKIRVKAGTALKLDEVIAEFES
jgi:propionyl-CoA carboxylase alpha chain